MAPRAIPGSADMSDSMLCLIMLQWRDPLVLNPNFAPVLASPSASHPLRCMVFGKVMNPVRQTYTARPSVNIDGSHLCPVNLRSPEAAAVLGDA